MSRLQSDFPLTVSIPPSEKRLMQKLQPWLSCFSALDASFKLNPASLMAPNHCDISIHSSTGSVAPVAQAQAVSQYETTDSFPQTQSRWRFWSIQNVHYSSSLGNRLCHVRCCCLMASIFLLKLDAERQSIILFSLAMRVNTAVLIFGLDDLCGGIALLKRKEICL